ncbi:MAG: Usg family protein [Rhodospirillaceae bacterium]|nr:Usg family protein [Rhodospirillaceae bacterium]
MEQPALSLQLNDYRLVTAEILYHLPDHPGLLQSYVWQDYDLAPRLPVLHKFLDFWSRNLEGKLHSIKVARAELITPPRWHRAEALLSIH